MQGTAESSPPGTGEGHVSDLDFGQLRRSSPQVRGCIQNTGLHVGLPSKDIPSS